ncbi:MAG: SAM-dependent methyltransferase, partial [Clostridia bacterium]|nr:SAM-dependent methyltransferase [Clostridia bacterium]
MAKTIETKIDKLILDDKNMNKHNQYGMHLLEKSISELGLGRSILVDKNNKIIAGNGVTETAAQLGLDEVIIVPTDGKKLVVVQRTDLDIDSKEARELALADNAVAHVNLEWDAEAVKSIAEEWGVSPEDWGVDLPELK